MKRIFVDASVLFAAAYSATGASREIVRRALGGEWQLVVSDLVLEEVRRNLGIKAPGVVADFEALCAAVDFEVVRASRAEVEAAAQYVAVKDAPIVAGARQAEVDYLVSLDRRHLVDVQEVAQRSGLRIVLPERLLQELGERKGD